MKVVCSAKGGLTCCLFHFDRPRTRLGFVPQTAMLLCLTRYDESNMYNKDLLQPIFLMFGMFLSSVSFGIVQSQARRAWRS
jgi:hypothetical protein